MNLYENSFNYPMLISALVIVSNGTFIVLWIREFMILHKSFLIKKSPKSLLKWFEKITERPFQISLMWLCAIEDTPEEG